MGKFTALGNSSRRECLSTFCAALESVLDTQQPRLVVVEGRAGSGKSSFVDQIEEMAANYAMSYICGSASDGEACTPYFILREMIVTASKGQLAPTASIEAHINYLRSVNIDESDYPILHEVLPYLSLNLDQTAAAVVVSWGADLPVVRLNDH